MTILYEKLLYENLDKGEQLKLVISEFRGIEYIQIRKYFLSYDEGFIPSREGITIPTSIEVIYSLLDGLVDILSKEEVKEIFKKYFSDKINELNK